MKTFLAFATFALLFLPPIAFGASNEQCPALPTQSGIDWTHQQGPDFEVCFATDSETHKDLFGIYYGRYPQFSTDDAKVVGSGVVAGKSVKWYGPTPKVEDSRFRRQTIVQLTDGMVMHVWISADTDSGVQKAQEAVTHMKLPPQW
jgi:hypothetical protein